MRSSSILTPPRNSARSRIRDYTPRLTPSSDSSSASPDGEGGVSSAGYTTTSSLSKSTTHKSSSRRQRKDASILRGAALIRESIVASSSSSTHSPRNNSSVATSTHCSPRRGMDPPAERSLFDDTDEEEGDDDEEFDDDDEEDELQQDELPLLEEDDENDHIFHDDEEEDFSDPWAEEKQRDLQNTHTSSSLPSSLMSSSLPSSMMPTDDDEAEHSLDGHIHWATMAIIPREDNEVDALGPRRRRNLLDNDDDTEESPPPPPPSHPPPPDDGASLVTEGTHITHMGRGKSLRVKMVTYHVQSAQDMMDDTTCGGSYESFAQQQQQQQQQNGGSPRRKLSLRKRQAAATPEEPTRAIIPLPPAPTLASPLLPAFEELQRMPAYRHAQDAGYVWQSLVGQHVRFPKHWFDGARGPPVGGNDVSWHYLARHSVRDNAIFAHVVKNRSSPGRLLLHLIVRDDVMTGAFDIAIGVFHPNARGIRRGARADPREEANRHVWMAIRKQPNAPVSLLDNVLCRTNNAMAESPLGSDRRSVTNVNMRAVFGEEAPLQTICILESELYEKLELAAELDPTSAPALLILQEFLVLG